MEMDIRMGGLAKCKVTSVSALRDVASRIEAGETQGRIYDDYGRELGWFDCMPEVLNQSPDYS